ncbi:MAG: cell division protein SepF [Lachnospiraceae bacterium]|nr:cell division protein SepF [Lachnospiraceae bacterium]
MGLNSILNFFKLDEDLDDDYDDNGFEETYEEKSEPPRRKTSRPRPVDEYEEEPKQRSGFLGTKPKVVSMNRSMMEVNIIKPTSFEDSQEICNMLLAGQPVVVNLEGFDPDDAQRIMDFISGCIYAINGKYHQISKYIFIFSPENVDISGDSLTIDGNTATMPTINREF